MAMRPPVGAPTLSRRTRILLIVAGVARPAAARRLPAAQPLRRLAVVRRGRLPQRVLHRAVHPRAAVPLGAAADGRAGRAHPVDRLPLPAGVRAGQRPGGPDRPLPHGDHPAPAAVRRSASRWSSASSRASRRRATGRPCSCSCNSTPFGVTDPVFGIDVSFYAFQLPFYRLVLNWLFVAVAISFVAALVTHYLFGGIRLTGPRRAGLGRRARPAGRAGGRVRAAQGRGLLLRPLRAAVLRPQPDVFYGATYTDLNAVMPAKLILLFISVICAAAFFVGGVPAQPAAPRDRARCCWCCPACWSARRGPRCCSSSSVAPNANEREAASIQRNIDATRAGVRPRRQTRSHIQPYAGTSDGDTRRRSVADDGHDAEHPAARPEQALRDVHPAPAAARTSTASRRSSTSTATTVNGQVQDYVVAARELNTDGLTGNQTDWINRHLVYTHGNGLVAAPGQPGQRAAGRVRRRPGRPAAVHQHRHHQRRTTRDPGEPEGQGAADLLRRADHRLLDRRRARAAPPRASTTPTRRATPTPAPAACRSATSSTARSFALEYGERNILFNSSINDDSKIMYVPEAGGPGPGGRAVADHRLRPVPRGGRRADHLDRRRLHHAAELPVRRGGGARLRPPPTRRTPAQPRAEPVDQLPAQLGEGHRRRLQRQRHALRVRRHRPGAEDVDEGVPGHRAAQHGDQPEPAVAPAVPGGPVQGAA